MSEQLIVGQIFATVLMFVLWCIQLRTNDAGVVDVGWSASLGCLALFYAVTSANESSRVWLIAGMAAVWSFRLAIHLLYDRVLGKPEDGRYQQLRTRFGSRAQLFFLGFFQLQALLACLFSLEFLLAMRPVDPLNAWDAVGFALWLIAIWGEASADSQLARFRADPAHKGQTCRAGLWRYSRHPNYFFEWLHWCSYVFIAWQASFGWIAIFAPALILFFLFKVTGIPTTEAQALHSRGDDYRDYQRTTSVFIPWFPSACRTDVSR